MSSALRSIVIVSFATLAALLTAPGCSQQTEGERCDSAKNGDDDCDSGLTCVSANELLSGETDRCCPEEGQETDSRCTRGTPVGTGGSSNNGGSSNSSAGSGDAAGDGSGTPAAAGAPTSSGGTAAAGGIGAGAAASTDAGGSPSAAAGAGQGGAG